MKRKRLLLTLGCLASALLTGYITLRLTAPRHSITEENVDSIRKGMKGSEVEALLGTRAGVFSSRGPTGSYWLGEQWNSGWTLIRDRGGNEWVADSVAVWVRFDETGCVAQFLKGNVWAKHASTPLLTKLRHWLGM